MICIPITAPNLTAKILLFCREWRRPRFYLSRNPLLLGKKVHHIHGILGTEEMQKQAALPLYNHMEGHAVRKYYGEWDGAGVAQELADEMTSRGLIATYNHPVWSRVREEEFIHTRGIWALEIYNYGTENESATGYDEAGGM